jgi:Putative cyclase.
MESRNVPYIGELLKESPKNWGKWGPTDEVGSLNYLGAAEILKGIATVKQGKTFTLQVKMGDPNGDPVWPGRQGAKRMSVMDRGHYNCGKGPVFPGSYQYADDVMFMYLQGSTQYDALGHVWYDDQIWNGYDADTTIGGLAKASVCPIGERGVVGRGILIDMARYRKKDVLDPGETFTHVDLMAAAEAQGVTIEKRDILIIRTGWIGSFYKKAMMSFTLTSRNPVLPTVLNWSTGFRTWKFQISSPTRLPTR